MQTDDEGCTKRNAKLLVLNSREMKSANFFFLGAYLLALQFTTSVEASFNITHNLLRTAQTFNLTVSDSCTSTYSVDFGDSTVVNGIDPQQKIVSHTYGTAGNYNIVMQSSVGGSSECMSATKSVEVRDPIQNMTITLNTTMCRPGEHVSISVEVIPAQDQVNVYWRLNKTVNWIEAPVECKTLGEIDVYVMADNGVSVLSGECFELLKALDVDFTFNPENGGTNHTVEITKTSLTGVSDESNYTFVWEFHDGDVVNCSNQTVEKYFTTANPDPGFLVILNVFNEQGHSIRREKFIKVYELIQPPIQVTYPNATSTNSPIEFLVRPHVGDGAIYDWHFGDNSTNQNSTNRTMTYSYPSTGEYCVTLAVKNDFSEAIISFKISVFEEIDGFGFVKNITPVETGFPTNIGIEVSNGSNVNISVSFGDGSESVWIVNIDEVMDIFVISIWHNYTSSGHYNVTITAQNPLNVFTASSVAEVQDPVSNLTVQKTYATECLEVNGSLSVVLTVNGSYPRYYYLFGEGTNMTSSVSKANHSYSTHGYYFLNITAFNDVSSVTEIHNVTVCKPVIPIKTLAVTTSPTNISDPVEFTMTLVEGSDFECSFNCGDSGLEFFTRDCYNLTYFADGVNTDKTSFMNLEFKVSHNYTDAGSYEVRVNCSNRLSKANLTLYAIVQKPIEDLNLTEISPRILGHNFPVNWTLTNGTNVTFTMKIQETSVNYSSFKTDMGDNPIVSVSSAGVFLITLQATNLVSEANRSITLIVQDDVTLVTFATFTTTSDFGSNIRGLGPDNSAFPCEYPVNFTATPDKGTNLTFRWTLDAGVELNTTESSITHQFADEEKEFWTNVTVFNLVSRVTKVLRVQMERSVMNLIITDNSPVKVNSSTNFVLSFSKRGTKSCIKMNMGDGQGLYVFGGSHCQAVGYTYVSNAEEDILSIYHSYTYETVNKFLVIVNASNTVSRQPLVFKSVTVLLSCYYPNATILDVGLNASTARKLNRSESFLIETDTEVDCEASKTTAFRWEISKISQDPVTYHPQPDTTANTTVDILNNDQSFLYIPAASLEFGFYKLSFTVIMEGVVGISGSAVGYVHVVATQGSLHAAVEGGPRKRYKFGSTIPLSAKPSVDSDYADINEATPQYYWLCRNSSEPAFNTSGNISADIPLVYMPGQVLDNSNLNASENLGGCFGTGPGRLNFTGSLEQIDSRRGMAENSTYVITLVVDTHNPFFAKRDVFSQTLVIVHGDPPEVEVACPRLCPKKMNIDQKVPLKGTCVLCYGELTFAWNLYRHTAPDMDPTDTDHMEEDLNLEELSTTSIHSLDLAIRHSVLTRDTSYTATFKAFRPSGQYGEYFHTFITNSPPENGICDVTPKSGTAMNTSYTITCGGWADPDQPLTYEFAYINHFQPSVLYVSQDPVASSIVLPMGHEANDFILPLVIRIFDHLNAATTVTINIQVLPPTLDKVSLKDIISDEDGFLKEALKTGDLKKVVEIVNAVGSVLNYLSRKDDVVIQNENVAEAESASFQEQQNTREQFRTEILKVLGEFDIFTLEQIKLVASAIDVTTEMPTEVNTQAGEMALTLIDKMTAILATNSENNAGFEAIKDASASLLSGIGNAIVSSASLAKVDANDTSENITGYTSNPTDGGIVSRKKSAKSRTLKFLGKIEEISEIIFDNIVTGDLPVSVNTSNFNLTLQKVIMEQLGGTAISNGETKFILPSLEEMRMSSDSNGTEKYSSVEVKLTSFINNIFTWSTTSNEVKSYAVSLSLKDKERKPLNTSNFTEDAHIHIPRNARFLPSQDEFHLIPKGANEYIQYHAFQVESVNFSVHIQITPVNESKEMTVFLLYDERPSPEKFDYNWTVPDFSSCSFRNVSKNVSSSSNSSEGSDANATNPTETEYQIVIDVVRDCVKDPYTVFISNSMVTEPGTYYIGVYYNEIPDPETETEADPDMQTSASPPTGARKRRGVPLACSGSHRRMKRSCVIIPPPPPKPTTPSKYHESTKPPNVDFQGNTFNPNETEHYLLRVFSSNCLFWDEENENWINKGCKVGDETKPEVIHCKCNHLTSFASDFVVAPNPIDFDKVFSADLSKNFVVLLVVCLLFGLYIVLIIIARRFDNKDLEKLGATAVNNRGDASFPYLISIHTGARQNAGTTSSVFIVLSGDEWECSPMPLADYDRKVFQRGQESNFVVTLPRSLGNISHIRIWHDNYGNNASWYLSRVSVDDLRTEERWCFVCERWLAVEEDDGRVDRMLPVASDKELTHFQHLFVSKTVRELGDGHLWFSVVTRPANSPFTRVQRVSCCLSLLCLTMLTNAMFYGAGDGAESTMMIRIGSYEFDLRGVIIGIEASLIVFPVNLALVQIFRSVRPKRSKRQPDPETTEGTRERTGEDFSDISRCDSLEMLPNASSQEHIINKEGEDNSKKKDDKTKKKKKGLPHGLVYVAWVLCFLSSVTGAVFTVFYALAWGPEKANKWLIAFVLSFVQSILVIQPVKVVFAALLFAMVIRKPMDSDQDSSEKKKLKASANGKETGDDIVLDYDEDIENYRPPDHEFLNSAREQRLKEVRMSEILKEVFAYFLFVLLLLLVAYGNRDPKAYLLRKTLNDIFVDVDETGVDLQDADDVDLFFHWARETLVPNLYPGVLYNNKSDKYSGFIDDRNNYLVGISRFRQARVEKDSCVITDKFQRYFNDCMAEYSIMDEDMEDYDIGWKFLNKTGTTNSRRRRSVEEQFAFRKGDDTLREFGDPSHVRSRRGIVPVYTSTSGRQQRKRKRPGNTAKNYYVLDNAVLPDGSIISCPTRWLYKNTLDLRGYPFFGHMSLYSGGGYSADLGYDYATALTVIADLHSHNWVDPQTRSVFVELTVYNANVNLFGIAFMFVEFLPTGGAFPQVHFVVSRLYSYVGPFSNFILACQIFLVLFMFYFMYREGKLMYKKRKAYFHGFFNWMEVMMIICEFAMGILYLARWWQVDKNFMKLRHNPKDFVSFQYAGAADESLSLIMGLLVFLVTLRFLKLFRFNKRMSLLGSTIGKCAKPLGLFLVSFMLVFLAYANFGFLAFSNDNENFKNFLSTFETQTSIILGDFDFKDIERTNRLLGPIYFFTFMYFSVFYLLNMFMAIINDTFADVKSSNDKQQNDYEMMEFILSSFKESLGLKRNRIGISGSKLSGFPSSPPFQPSDYKYRDGEDSLSGCKEVDDRPPTGQNGVLRILAALDKNLDQLTSFMEKCSEDEDNDEKMLIDMLNNMEKKNVELRPHTAASKCASICSSTIA